MAIDLTDIEFPPIRTIEVQTTGEPFFDCENQSITCGDLARMLIVYDEGEGEYVLRVNSD